MTPFLSNLWLSLWRAWSLFHNTLTSCWCWRNRTCCWKFIRKTKQRFLDPQINQPSIRWYQVKKYDDFSEENRFSACVNNQFKPFYFLKFGLELVRLCHHIYLFILNFVKRLGIHFQLSFLKSYWRSIKHTKTGEQYRPHWHTDTAMYVKHAKLKLYSNFDPRANMT